MSLKYSSVADFSQGFPLLPWDQEAPSTVFMKQSWPQLFDVFWLINEYFMNKNKRNIKWKETRHTQRKMPQLSSAPCWERCFYPRLSAEGCVGQEVTCQEVQVPACRRSGLVTATEYQQLLQERFPEHENNLLPLWVVEIAMVLDRYYSVR